MGGRAKIVGRCIKGCIEGSKKVVEIKVIYIDCVYGCWEVTDRLHFGCGKVVSQCHFATSSRCH